MQTSLSDFMPLGFAWNQISAPDAYLTDKSAILHFLMLATGEQN